MKNFFFVIEMTLKMKCFFFTAIDCILHSWRRCVLWVLCFVV